MIPILLVSATACSYPAEARGAFTRISGIRVFVRVLLELVTLVKKFTVLNGISRTLNSVSISLMSMPTGTYLIKYFMGRSPLTL